MTAYVTRAPLQLINNPHMMSEGSGHGRRTSKRLEEKEDAPLVNGIGHENEPVRASQKENAKTGKAKVNGASAKPVAKRKPAYDEEDDGFAFTRTRAKKAKAEPLQPSTAEENTQKPQEKAAPAKRSRKKSIESPDVPATEKEAQVPRRRSARHSGEHEKASADPPPLQVKKRRKDRGSSEIKADQGVEQPLAPQDRSRNEASQDHPQPIEITFDATKIALPFADTPRIQRNKDMRKTNAARRSSLGLRGRRASSLIDSGKSTAMPHDEVESSEFYKHIEREGLSEPRRMKQLLTWCGTRALGEKPSFSSEDCHARQAAREIQKQLLQDFQKKSELSDWFNRNETTPPPSLPKPNPKNLSNQAKIQDLEQQIARLRTERETWDSRLRPPPTSASSLPPSPTTPPPPSTLDPTLLTSPTQLSALETLQSFTADFQPSLSATTSARLQRINENLDFEIDKFADNVHALEAYKNAAEKVADGVLGVAAERLERREKVAAGGEAGEVGMRDVLRGLSRVVER